MQRKIFLFISLVFLLSISIGCGNLKNDSNLEKQQKEIYQLAVDVGFDGTYEEWLESIKGEQGIPGINGKNVELIVIDNYIKWRNVGDANWYELISIDLLIGEKGEDIELQVSNGYIQWKLQEDLTWNDLLSLSSLIGPSGIDGKEVSFNVVDGFIQWQYDGDSEWTNLIELSSLKGPKGDTGISAYQLYLETVADGETPFTLEEWLNSLSNNVSDIAVVIFKGLYNDIIDVQLIDIDSNAVAPKIPEYEGHVFVQWDKDFNNVSANKVVNAVYKPIKYTVTFDSNGGKLVDPITGDYGTKLLLPTPIKKGFDFIGWYDSLNANGKLYNNESIYNDSITLYAKWEISKYQVTFVDFNDSVLSVQEVKYNFSASEPKDPERTGYTFISWDTDYISVDSNLTVKALYDINKYTLNFETFEGSQVESITQYYNTIINQPKNPTKEGYTFSYWCLDETLNIPFEFTALTKMPGNDFNLYAKWNLNQYTITYNDFMNIGFDEVVSGRYHSLALTPDNRLFAWGSNTYGQLGDGTTIQKLTPIEITNNLDLSDGEVVVDIIAGGLFSLAITSNGKVFAWGYNINGQLGDGTLDNKLMPIEINNFFNLSLNETIIDIQAGALHSIAITSDKRVLAWGSNTYGQVGDGSFTSYKTLPIDITSNFNLALNETIEAISADGYHTFAISSNNRLFAWGFNNNGQLGDGTIISREVPIDITSNFNLPIGEVIDYVSGGLIHSSAITSNGRVFSWGCNDNGELGDGTLISKLYPTDITINFGLSFGERIDEILIGSDHSVALTTDGNVYTWGKNEFL